MGTSRLEWTLVLDIKGVEAVPWGLWLFLRCGHIGREGSGGAPRAGGTVHVRTRFRELKQ